MQQFGSDEYGNRDGFKSINLIYMLVWWNRQTQRS